MGYIDIPVDVDNQAKVIEWFADIHVGSKIDLSIKEDKTTLYNVSRKGLVVSGYNADDVFNLIEPKSSRGWYDEDIFLNAIRPKCRKAIDYISSFHRERDLTDRELFGLYLTEAEFNAYSEPVWYVGDIRVKDAERGSDNE